MAPIRQSTNLITFKILKPVIIATQWDTEWQEIHCCTGQAKVTEPNLIT